MGFLLDSHVYLWWVAGSDELSGRAADAIGEGGPVHVSIVTPWELALKAGLGQLDVPADLWTKFDDDRVELLGVTLDDARRVGGLPFHHRDPFDRMMIAQAIGRGLTIVTRDRIFDQYGPSILRA